MRRLVQNRGRVQRERIRVDQRTLDAVRRESLDRLLADVNHVARRNDRNVAAFIQHVRTADFKGRLRRIDQRYVGTVRPHVAHAVIVRHQHGAVKRGDRVTRMERDACRMADATVDAGCGPEVGHVVQAHLAGSVGRERDAGVGAHDLDVRTGDLRHFDLVVGPGHEFREGACERYEAGGGQSHRGGDHVLFRDLALEESFRHPLGKYV